MMNLIINLIIILIVPFLMLGMIKKTKAFWGGRKGPSIFQPLFNFIKLVRKDLVISKTTSGIFRISPIISFCTVIFASLFIPLCCGMTFINIPAGFIIFAYILGLGKFFSLLGAMDTGSSFEGMGASREACFTTIVEPAFFVILASIMLITGNYTFNSFVELLTEKGNYGYLVIAFSILAIFLMILIEGSRVPVDDPETHLELTMIHEVMILDNSGLDLGLLTWGNAIKMMLLSSLIANLLIPVGIGLAASIALYLLVMLIISVLIGTVESGMARIRMSHTFEFVFIMNSLALVVFALSIASGFGG